LFDDDEAADDAFGEAVIAALPLWAREA